MSSFIKVKLFGKSDNSFKGFGLVVRNVLSNGSVKFLLITSKELFPAATENNTACSFALANGARIRRSQGLCAQVMSSHCQVDSFSTVIVAERAEAEGLFRNFIVHSDYVETQLDCDYAVDFDSLFAAERERALADSSILVKNNYEQRNVYSGFQSYHHYHHQGFNNPVVGSESPYKIGVELEIYARNRSSYEKITGARTNWFQCERDGSLTQSVNGVSGLGIEIKTIPLRREDAVSASFWEEPLNKLSALGLSKEYSSTGLHVHIGKEAFGATPREQQKNIDKLCFFYVYMVEDVPENHAKNVIICGREHGYSGELSDCKSPLADFVMRNHLVNLTGAESAVLEAAHDVNSIMSRSRWDINLQHLNDYGTVEFRKAKGSIGLTRMIAVISWWEQMILYTKSRSLTECSFDGFLQFACQNSPEIAFYFRTASEC